MYNAAYHVQQQRYPPQQPAAPQQNAPLPPGWTEHKAPSGHTYYHNKALNKSTYTRPMPLPEPATVSDSQPSTTAFIPSYSAGQFAGGYNASQFQAPPEQRGYREGRSQQKPPRRPDNDRPKHKYAIPGCAPWVLVKTKYGRRFVHNTETSESLWKFPGHVMTGVIEFDKRERERQEQRERGESSDVDVDEEAEMAESKEVKIVPVRPGTEEEGDDGESEYEEVEVTDSEADGEDGGEPQDGSAKRQRTEELDQEDEGPREFTEEDMMYQLEAMQEDQDIDGPFEDEYYEDEPPLSEEDARALFRDLLDDHRICPFTPWDRIIEAGQIIDDERYVALPTMKSRRDCFDEWARERIHTLREQREKQAKQDPRVPYFQLLDEQASTKLYWPEFKRKFRKESAMKDAKLSDRDREKYYREHVKRLAVAKDVLKKDLSALLKSLPLAVLNRDTNLQALPSQLLTDLRYISLPAGTRDPMIEAYISTLDPAPQNDGDSRETGTAEAEKKRDRERREKALREREERVHEAKRRQQRDLRYGKERLQEQEEELRRALKIGKRGLETHLRDQADQQMAEAPEK